MDIKAGETYTIAEIEGPGSVQHIWMTPTGNWRWSILRFYWDRETTPSVEVPVGIPYSGLAQVIKGDGHYDVSQRFGLYRWHITDPIRFEKNLRVTIQALGWRDGGRYLPLQVSSTVFWYQTEPHAPFPKLPGKDALEVN